MFLKLKYLPLLGFVSSFLCFNISSAQEASMREDAPAQKIIKQKLMTLPGMTEKDIGEIKSSLIPGLYEVDLQGVGPVYMSPDGRYFIHGDMWELQDGKMLNHSELRQKSYAKNLVDKVPESDMIIFAPQPAKNIKAKVTVFTDVDCAYCRKLHSQVEEYNKLGIEIRYMAWPRGGLKSSTYSRMVSVWCAKDRNAALTEAKSGKAVAETQCADNPVEKEYEIGVQIGLRGTPGILLPDGRLLPGYLEPDALAKELGL